MPISTSVKYFHSAMSGAPVLSGVAGTLITVLDACLINGFNLKTADSVAVASGLATFNVSTGIGAFEADTVVLIEGATPAGLNGEKRVISITGTSIVFDAEGISDQTATGTITAKLAPAGWSKAFTGTNLAAYRSNDVTGTRMFLRVDDTATTNGRVLGYESMSDINTGIGSISYVAGGHYWAKANAANATARGWTVVADSKTFYIWTHTVTSSIGIAGVTNGFGDFTSMKSGDAYACLLQGASSDTSATTTAILETLQHGYNATINANGMVIARSYTAIGGSLAAIRRVESYAYSDGHSGSTAWIASFPNPMDNSLLLSRMLVLESAGIRGVLRGPLFVPHNCHASFNWRDKVDGQGANAGRKLLALKGNAPAGTASAAVMFFDITGPWG